MQRISSINEAVEVLLTTAEPLIRNAVKELLETKHLYQSVSLVDTKIVDQIKSSVPLPFQEGAINEFLDHLRSNWTATYCRGQLWFKSPDVKLFCASCERLEAFNLVESSELWNHIVVGDTVTDRFSKDSQPVQVFALSYLCQACKLIPEVFVVRRMGLKLTLCGRAPIEHVEVPSFIPKPVQLFYRGGILAFQSGQFLAGNFMLRTVIEQWARIATHLETATQADKVLDAYMDSLPKDFKDRFPSVRDLYAVLSSDIHGAVGSPDLFERAQKEIVEHFDARRLLKLN